MGSGEESKKSQLSHAAHVLQSLMQGGKSPLAEQFIRWKLWNSWEEVAGKEISTHSMPVSFIRGTLYVWVKNSARMQEMTFVAGALKDKINQFAGKKWVNFIRFTLDRKSVPTHEESAEGLRNYRSAPVSGEGEDSSSGR